METQESGAMLQKQSVGRQIGAVSLMLLATAIWGAGFVFTKNALANMQPLYFLFFRYLLGSVALAICAFPRWSAMDANLIKKGLLAGIPLFFGYSLQTIGLQYTTVGNSAFITGSYVVMVPFVAWFVTRRLQGRQIAIGLLALVGLAIISLQGEFRINIGDIWTLGCAAAYAIHFVVLWRFTQKLDSLLLTLWQLIMGMVLSGLMALIMETPPTAAVFNSDMWVALIYCGVFATALAFFIQTSAQKILLPAQASVIFTSESLFGAFFGWLLLGELFTTRQFLGAGILLFCMVAVLVEKRPKNKEINAEANK